MLFKQINILLDVLVLFLVSYLVFEGGLSFLDFHYHTYDGNVTIAFINTSLILLVLILAMFLYYKYLNSKIINYSIATIFILISILLYFYRPSILNMLIHQDPLESKFNILNFICYADIVTIFISGVVKLFTFIFKDKFCNYNKKTILSLYCVFISGIYAAIVYLKEGFNLDGNFLSDLYFINYLFTPLIVTFVIFILSLFKFDFSMLIISLILYVYLIFCSILSGYYGVIDNFPKSTFELRFMSLVLLFLAVNINVNINMSN